MFAPIAFRDNLTSRLQILQPLVSMELGHDDGTMNLAQRALEQLNAWPDLTAGPASCGTGRALRSPCSEIVHFHSGSEADVHLTSPAIQRFSGTETAKLGFVSVKYMDADVVLDGGMQLNWTSTGAAGTAPNSVPATSAYFLNTKYLHYRPHSARNMVPLNPGQRYSVNQDASVQILAWAGNLTSSGLQFQGRMDNT